MRTAYAAWACAALLSLHGVAAYGWGADGHSIVAEIAQRRLTPEAAAAVARLLGPGGSLASVASWADDVRGARKETYNWHFVDIPRDQSAYDEKRDCHDGERGDCIVKELQRLQHDLRCAATEPARREALQFSVHFVGDVHQPLHAVGDKRGGNEVPVHGSLHGQTCQGRCDIAAEAGNLHSLWDSGLIRRTVWAWGAYVDRLEQGWLKTDATQRTAPPQPAGGWQGGAQAWRQADSPQDWALQSHAVAKLVWNDKLVPADGTLDDRYYQAVLPILDQQLALAGVRLARMLNEAYASSRCDAPAPSVVSLPGEESGLRAVANVGEAKTEAEAYHDRPSGAAASRYEQDQARVADAAVAWVQQRAKAVPRPALVLDIDETSLDNWQEIKANDFGYIPGGDCTLAPGLACGASAWELSARAPVITATLKLFNAAAASGVAVFFITGRHENERAATEQNLKRAGYQGWRQLVMRPDGSSTPSASDYKAPERARIVMQGYTIIANVGDQPSDLVGGYAEKSFLMPNPFYRIP